MIQTMGTDMIQATLIEDIKSSGVHDIMADEVTSDNAEIASLCFRFVDSKDNIHVREEFLEFVGYKPHNWRKDFGDNTAILQGYRTGH